MYIQIFIMIKHYNLDMTLQLFAENSNSTESEI